MGRKSKNAGTTKNRQRTCDKEAKRNAIDKVLTSYGGCIRRNGAEMKAIISQVKAMEEEAKIDGVDSISLDTWSGMGSLAKYHKKSVREFTGFNKTKCVVLDEVDTFKNDETGETFSINRNDRISYINVNNW